jgi:hypothetical protein
MSLVQAETLEDMLSISGAIVKEVNEENPEEVVVTIDLDGVEYDLVWVPDYWERGVGSWAPVDNVPEGKEVDPTLSGIPEILIPTATDSEVNLDYIIHPDTGEQIELPLVVVPSLGEMRMSELATMDPDILMQQVVIPWFEENLAQFGYEEQDVMGILNDLESMRAIPFFSIASSAENKGYHLYRELHMGAGKIGLPEPHDDVGVSIHMPTAVVGIPLGIENEGSSKLFAAVTSCVGELSLNKITMNGDGEIKDFAGIGKVGAPDGGVEVGLMIIGRDERDAFEGIGFDPLLQLVSEVATEEEIHEIREVIGSGDIEKAKAELKKYRSAAVFPRWIIVNN